MPGPGTVIFRNFSKSQKFPSPLFSNSGPKPDPDPDNSRKSPGPGPRPGKDPDLTQVSNSTSTSTSISPGFQHKGSARPQFDSQTNPWNRLSTFNGEIAVYGIDICIQSEFDPWEQNLFINGINTIIEEILWIWTISEEK